MAEIIVAEFEALARPSMRTFQTLVIGKIGQAGAPVTCGGGSPIRPAMVALGRMGRGFAADAGRARVAAKSATRMMAADAGPTGRGEPRDRPAAGADGSRDRRRVRASACR